jgi:hypothetical protein
VIHFFYCSITYVYYLPICHGLGDAGFELRSDVRSRKRTGYRIGYFVASRPIEPPAPGGTKIIQLACVSEAMFSFSYLPLNFIMQKEDSPSHQNIGTCMKY